MLSDLISSRKISKNTMQSRLSEVTSLVLRSQWASVLAQGESWGRGQCGLSGISPCDLAAVRAVEITEISQFTVS